MAHLTKDRQQEIDSIIENIQLQTGLVYPYDDLTKLATELDLEVYTVKFAPEWDDVVSGAIEYSDDDTGAKIYLNADYSKERRTFTLAHELGHFFLHKGEHKLRIDVIDYSKNTADVKAESEANYFAASLLVPTPTLLQVVSVTSNIDKMAKYFGVSAAVIQNRLAWIRKNQPELMS